MTVMAYPGSAKLALPWLQIGMISLIKIKKNSKDMSVTNVF